MQKEKTAYNSTYKKLAVQCSADTFVVNGYLVLRNYICADRRQLLVAAKRYAPFKNDRPDESKKNVNLCLILKPEKYV